MRSSWQEHIRKTHSKLLRKHKTQKYHDSMRMASKTWEKEKIKIIKRNKRLVRIQKQSAASKASTSDKSCSDGSIKSSIEM